MSPRPRVAPQRRRQIVEALFRCMARKGYAGASITDIAAEARVARGAINFFFRGKAEILRALLDRAIADYRAALRPILGRGGPADEQLRAALKVLLATGPAARRATVVFLNYYALAPGNPAVAAPLRAFFREYRRLFALIIRRGIRQGCYPRGTDAESAAAILVAAVEGLLLQWVIDAEGTDPGGALPWLERLVATGGGQRPPRAGTERLSHGPADR